MVDALGQVSLEGRADARNLGTLTDDCLTMGGRGVTLHQLVNNLSRPPPPEMEGVGPPPSDGRGPTARRQPPLQRPPR